MARNLRRPCLRRCEASLKLTRLFAAVNLAISVALGYTFLASDRDTAKALKLEIAMVKFQCPSCGKRLRIRDEHIGKRLKCPGCHKSFPAQGAENGNQKAVAGTDHVLSDDSVPEVPALNAIDQIQGAMAKWTAFYRNHIRLDWRLAGPHLRCCVNCNHRQFTHNQPCTSCGEATVGLDLASVFEGTDGSAQSAVGAYRRAKKSRLRAGFAVWTLTCLSIVVALLIRCWLGVLISIVLIPAAALAHIGVLLAIRSRFRRRYEEANKRTKSCFPDSTEKLEKFCDEVVHPFFARNGIIEGRPVRAAKEEISLLAALFRRDGWSTVDSEPHDWLAFLTACALRRDFESFRQRIEYYQNANPIGVYANLVPDPQCDETNLPFLREYLSEKNATASIDDLIFLVDRYRAEFKLKAFSQDLEQRRKTESINVSIVQVDAMNPFNFEQLLGMIYEAEGYRIEVTKKSGDQGADVIIEKAGERSVVQAKLYSNPVGNWAVQEVLAAKTYYRCQHAMVVTNNSFTRSALDLASIANVSLVNRQGLIVLLDGFNKRAKDYSRLAMFLTPAVLPSELPKVDSLALPAGDDTAIRERPNTFGV